MNIYTFSKKSRENYILYWKNRKKGYKSKKSEDILPFIYKTMHKKLLVLASYLGLLLLVGCGAPQHPQDPKETNTDQLVVSTGDEVEFSYFISFLDGTIYQTGQTSIKIWTTNSERLNHNELLNTKIGQSIEGELAPGKISTANTYNAAKKQVLSKVYFEELGLSPKTGLQVFIPGIGSWEITKEEIQERYNYYTIEFNPPETYKPLRYSIKILDIKKA